MVNINTRYSESVKEFQNKVIDYVKSKSKIGPLAAALCYTQTMHDKVSSALIQEIETTGTKQEIPQFYDKQPEARE